MIGGLGGRGLGLTVPEGKSRQSHGTGGGLGEGSTGYGVPFGRRRRPRKFEVMMAFCGRK